MYIAQVSASKNEQLNGSSLCKEISVVIRTSNEWAKKKTKQNKQIKHDSNSCEQGNTCGHVRALQKVVLGWPWDNAFMNASCFDDKKT